jgi:glycosyltransferase involved in cell wall biosynthesis
MSIEVSIVVPLFNEEESVEKLLASILNVMRATSQTFEILFVDDGSIDNTWEIVRKLRIGTPELCGIRLRRNFGQTAAMVAGFDHAIGEIIVTMDGDLQNDPADIPLLLENIAAGYDIVSGWRKNRQDHFSRVLPSRVANFLISTTTGVKLHDYGCSLKAYRTECIQTIQAYGEMHRFFPALASMTGASILEIPVNHRSRKYGVSKYGFNRIFKVFSDIFAMNLIVRFSSKPLKGFAVTSIPFLLLTIIFGSLAVMAHQLHWTPGKSLFFFISTALSGMAFIHLITLGVLAELVVGTSDLSHTQLAEVTRRKLRMDKNWQPDDSKIIKAE